MTEEQQQNESRDTMTFMEHLEELRQRLIKCLVAVVVGVLVCWFFREELRQFLEAPLYTAWQSVPGLPAPSPLSFTSLMEPFVAYLKIAGIGGLFFASPVVFYQLWRFVSPGLYKNEKRMALPFVMISSLLFIVGSAGAYAYVFPMGFSFFLQFSSGGNVDVYESGQVALISKTKPAEQSSVASSKHAGAKRKAETDKDSQRQPGETVAKEKPASTAQSSRSDTDTLTAVGTASRNPSDMGSGKGDSGLESGSVNPPPTGKASTASTAPAGKAIYTDAKSTPKVKSPPKKSRHRTAQRQTDKWEKARQLYTWVQKKLTGENCGEFKVTPEEKGVRLRFSYSTTRCGKKPVAFELARNDKVLPLTFDLVSEKNGLAVYQAWDSDVHRKSVSYRLSAVREASQKLLPVLMVKDYLDFAVKLMLAFGLVFELPILIFFLAYAGIVDYIQLIKFGRWFVVLSLTVAAILTPPDVVTQILLATPLVVLYYLSIGVVFLLGRKRNKSGKNSR